MCEKHNEENPFIDILWLLLAVPLTYFVSLPLKKILDAAKTGSREHVLILLLITATLVPCLIVNLCQPRLMFSLVFVYAFPFFLPFFSALSHTRSDLVILAILLLILVIVVFALKKLKIKNSFWYALWVFYVITTYVGVFSILTS